MRDKFPAWKLVYTSVELSDCYSGSSARVKMQLLFPVRCILAHRHVTPKDHYGNILLFCIDKFCEILKKEGRIYLFLNEM